MFNKGAVEQNLTCEMPIGLFDSGIGGLSIYQHLYQLLPNEKYLYFADTLNVPYGNRSHEEIIDLTVCAVRWLYKKGCKLIIIACNSASAHGLEIARSLFPNISIVGLVPALKPAVLSSKNKKVAVLATQATLDGQLLDNVINTIAKEYNIQVIKCFEPNLVPWIEAGMPDSCQTADYLKKLLEQLSQQKVDQLVLGCTHYPFFRAFAESYIAKNHWKINLVDSGSAIALRVRQLLKSSNLVNNNQLIENTELQLYSSNLDKKLEQVVSRILPTPIQYIQTTH